MQISKVSTKDILNNPLIEQPGKWTVCNSHWRIAFVFLDYFQIQLKLIRILWIMLNTNPCTIEYASIKSWRQQNLRGYFRQSDLPKNELNKQHLCDFNFGTLFLDCEKFIFIFLLDLEMQEKKLFPEKMKQQTVI